MIKHVFRKVYTEHIKLPAYIIFKYLYITIRCCASNSAIYLKFASRIIYNLRL
nr:MAG TPA: hypothetical protein [Caudoviricetes sp.]